jgi:hypothetical protein
MARTLQFFPGGIETRPDGAAGGIRKRTASVIAALAALSVVFSTAVQAQSLRGRSTDNAFQLRLGGFFPDGGGPLWTDVEQRFTLDAEDFDDAAVGFTLVHSMSNLWEVGFNVDFYDETVLSEEAMFVDEDGFPIFHDTRLETVPLTVDVRLVPGGRYRIRPGGRVLKPVFYLGAGIGANVWEYEEVGDFVDDADPLDPFVYFDRFEEDGVAWQTHVLAGAEFPLSPNFNLMLEGRYTWADDELDEDLAGFDRIELGGAWFFVGGAFRF